VKTTSERGIAQGFERGLLLGEQRVVLRILDGKFGPYPRRSGNGCRRWRRMPWPNCR